MAKAHRVFADSEQTRESGLRENYLINSTASINEEHVVKRVRKQYSSAVEPYQFAKKNEGRHLFVELNKHESNPLRED